MRNTRLRKPISSALIILLLSSFLSCFCTVSSYPILVGVEKHNKKCVSFEYGEDEKLDLAIVAVPYDVQDDQVEFYSRHYGKYKDYADLKLPDEVPRAVESVLKRYDRHAEAIGDIRVTIQVNPTGSRSYKQLIHQEKLVFHKPHIKKNFEYSKGELCLHNKSREWIKIIYNLIPVENELEDDDDNEEVSKMTEKIVQKDTHISPFESEVLKILKTGRKLRNHFNIADSMEDRMRRTSDGTHLRVKVLGYISIGFLLLTSFLQTRYLKSFFKKKKVI